MVAIVRFYAVTVLDDAIVASTCRTPFVAFGVNKTREEVTARTLPFLRASHAYLLGL
jgi:hypothetical protein